MLCALLLAGSSAIAGEVPGGPARPRIGLVLSGGGARGAAHVGVLKVLDELHVHVDAIAGTSMGAVVGGLYASGMSGAEIERLLSSVDWQDAFRDRPGRADLDFRHKQEERDFLVNVPLGIQGRTLKIPTGLLQGQKLVQILRRALLPVAGAQDFDHLPVPFRAVATDLETGAAVVMDSGDLTSALRASMAAPGVFTPVERDGRLLVDGGLVENLPIEVARAMHVDVLIVVDAGLPLRTRDHLDSLGSVSNQALAIMVRRDVERQRATLGGEDILLQPDLGEHSTFEFTQFPDLIRAGAGAARADQARLAALALRAGPAQPELVAAQPAPAQAAAPLIRFIDAEPGSEAYLPMLRAELAGQQDKPLDPAMLAARITDIYGRGNLEQLDYRLVTRPDGEAGLRFTARRKSWGPNYLRFGLSLQDDFEGNSTFNAAMRAKFTELNRLDGEAVLDLQIGASPRAALELYQPLSLEHRWFLAPHIQGNAHDLPQLEGGRQVGNFRVRTFEYGLDLGRALRSWGELRAGLIDSRGSTSVRLGDFSVPETSYHAYAGFARFSYDRLDSANFPRHGQALTLNLRFEDTRRGARGSDQFSLDWRGAWTHGKHTGMVWLSGGTTIGGSDANVRTWFPLGGFLNLSGLGAQSLAGPHYAIARALYLRSVGNGGEGILNVPAYAGLSLEFGNAWAQRSDARFGNLHHDAALLFGADTFLGPAYIAAGYDDVGSSAFYLFLGRSL
jgi:NTE family protein